MVDGLASWILERGALKRAARLPVDQGEPYLRRFSRAQFFGVWMSFVCAVWAAAVCFWSFHVLPTYPRFPDTLPASRIILYLFLFACLAIGFILFAIIGLAMRRILRKQIRL